CFFFQAEDGIRDRNVTGVQTCALPIYLPVDQTSPISMVLLLRAAGNPMWLSPVLQAEVTQIDSNVPVYDIETIVQRESEFLVHRSEERRVGKECRSRC